MYRCDDCNNDFETPKLVKDSESGDFHACPHCGKSDYYEIIECPECGKTEYIMDMPLFCGMCIDCFVKKYTDELGYRYFCDQSNEIKKDAIKNIYNINCYLNVYAFLALYAYFMSKYNESIESNIFPFCFGSNLKEWIFEDLTAFAEWCEDNEVFKNG